MGQTNILVIDDNPELRQMITLCLEQNGYAVFCASSGTEALHILRAKKVDTVLLDIGLPDVDGLTLISGIRELSEAPVVVISGKKSTTDKVVGLEMGADDYLAKPFAFEELNARVKANVRRHKNRNAPAQHAPEKITVGGITIDEAQFQAFTADGKSCNLTTMEFQLLRALAGSANRVMTRAQILDAFRAENPNINDRAIDIQVSRIRKKIGDDPREPRMIKTVRGIGYMLVSE
ncbi:MAG: response regulator transcription factor [Alphaproteobacteria bacterium]